MQIRKIFLLLFLLAPVCVTAQQTRRHGMGLVDDYEIIRQMPMKMELLTRSYESLPKACSLQQYCPHAGDQGQYYTCTAWATAYAAMTIMEAVRWGWTDRDVITSEAFSPYFVYARTKFQGDDNCRMGSGFYTALPLMKEVGVPKHRNFNAPCEDIVPRWVADEASDHTIKEFVRIFDDPYPSKDPKKKTRMAKKSIAEKKPVVIAMDVPLSFDNAGEAWHATMQPGEQLGKHSLCVVGYDDDRDGGAFLLFNSYGEQWGKDGFTWVKYTDFERFANYGFEIYFGGDELPVVIKPEPVKQETAITKAPETDKAPEIPETIMDGESEKQLTGNLNITLKSGGTEEQLQLERKDSKPCLRYRVESRFVVGSKFRINLSNEKPAFVYVIAADLKNKVDSIFPPPYKLNKTHISPALTYNSSEIALPGETKWAELDDNSSHSYLCVLYSSIALPMNQIMDYIEHHDGDIEIKLARALDTLCPGQRVNPKDIVSKKDRMTFRTTATGCIVPLIVEIRKTK